MPGGIFHTIPSALPRRGVALVVAVSALYFLIAAVVALYLLPVGFGLTGAALLAGQLGVIVIGAAAVAFVVTTIRSARRRREALEAIARERGWVYAADVGDRPWGGAVDEQIDRSARTTVDHLDARGDVVPFDTAERTFVVGDGDGAAIHRIRAVRIPLPAEAPRIVLRSRRGGGALSALPRRPRTGAELRLEGGFSDVFEVSVPAGYERDALYVLTPDLMAILLDTSADLDLEIVDGTLHVYLPAVDLTRPPELARLLALVGILSERFARRTFLYRDEAAAPVAPDAVRRAGDTLSAGAREVSSRARIGPVLAAVLTPLVPLVIGVVWVQLSG